MRGILGLDSSGAPDSPRPAPAERLSLADSPFSRGDILIQQLPKAIILFDGYCHVCDRTVQFVLDRDRDEYFAFAPLESTMGRQVMRRCDASLRHVDSLIVVERGRCYAKSAAALRIASQLPGLGWRFVSWLRIVPRPLRDWAYDLFARRRYRWFGRRESCVVPADDVRHRFLG